MLYIVSFKKIKDYDLLRMVCTFYSAFQFPFTSRYFQFATKHSTALNLYYIILFKSFQTSFTNMLVALLQNYLAFT